MREGRNRTLTYLNAKDYITALVIWCLTSFVVFLFWIFSFNALGIWFGSGGGLHHLHTTQPALWVLDVLPLLLALLHLRVKSLVRAKVDGLETELEEQRRTRLNNAEFAKAIGDGRYDTNFSVENSDDRLGTLLLSMRDNLRNTTRKEAERSWVTKGKDEVAYILRLHNNLQELGYEVLRKLIEYIDVVQGGLYLYDEESQELTGLATYAFNRRKLSQQTFRMGEGLVGQCAYERAPVYRTEIPPDYITITSGLLGDRRPKSLLLVPLITDEKLQGVLEFASLEEGIPERNQRFLEEVGEIIARTLYNLRINARTETLLQASQELTRELRANEEELRSSALQMERTQEELKESNTQLEVKIAEAENAQRRLHSLLENASEVITIYDTRGKLRYVSPSVNKILGYSPWEMESGKDRERLTQQGVDSLDEMISSLVASPLVPVTMQYVFLKRDGEKVWMEVTGRNMVDNPAIQGLIMNSRDITERLRAEKEERMKSKMQSLSENSIDMIVRLGMDGTFYYANPMVAHYLALQPEDLVNHVLQELEMPEVLKVAFQENLEAIRGDAQRREEEVQLGQGEGCKYLHLMAIPEFDEGVLETVLLVGHDVTETKRIEREIQDKSRKITESINYAQRIQSSILPDIKLLQQSFPRSFMFYRPKDVVSGDFPWFFEKDGYEYIAAVDCTGHGVPGALLSFIGYFTLNNIVDHDSSYTAGEVLDFLHAGVRTTLRQDRADADARDGMDIALCKINQKTQELEFAGAHRPLYLVRGGELVEYKGDRRAIGGIPNARKPEGHFTNHSIKLEAGDRIYFFSDGLPDQLGGQTGMSKYSPKHVRELLVEQHQLSMPKLGQFIVEDFDAHLGNHKQIDDVLLIGIEF